MSLDLKVLEVIKMGIKCDFSKERAEEHGGEYCIYNENGECTITPEIVAVFNEETYSWDPYCNSCRTAEIKEEEPIYYDIRRFIRRIRRRFRR